MKDVPAYLQELMDRGVTGVATCWWITRRDGQNYYFTDHDEPLTFYGATYQSIGAYRRTAIESTADLSVDNLDVLGISSSLSLPYEDLRAGLFDGAEVRIFLTVWQWYPADFIKLRRGYFGEVQLLRNGTFKASLMGLLQKLSYNYTNAYTASCLHDLGGVGCGIPVRPAAMLRSTAYAVGDYARVGQSTAYDGAAITLPIQDPDFSSAYSTGFDNSPYWRDSGAGAASVVQESTTKGPVEAGSYAVRGNATTGAMAVSQVVSLIDAGVTGAAIDAGSVYLSCHVWQAGGIDQGNLSVEFLDKAYATVSTTATGYAITSSAYERVGFDETVIPATTRYVRVNLLAQTAGGGPDVSVFFTAVHGFLIDTSVSGSLTRAENNVYWEVTTAGTTSGTEPAFTGSAGATVVDGTVTWTARNAWTRNAEIVLVRSNREVLIQVTESRAADAWFNGGVVTFEGGVNAGVSSELKQWTNNDSVVELYMSLPYDAKAGDLIRLYPGCDKSRIGCAVLFDNITNFFGFPDVPGQDNLYQTPDAKQS